MSLDYCYHQGSHLEGTRKLGNAREKPMLNFNFNPPDLWIGPLQNFVIHIVTHKYCDKPEVLIVKKKLRIICYMYSCK